MRILVVTPLYPPDIAGSAPYVKALATRLSMTHKVTVLAYGHIPEMVPRVRIRSIEKRDTLIVRLWRFTYALAQEMRAADIVLVENGPSVELPFFLASLIIWRKSFFHIFDEKAAAHAATSIFHRIPFALARLRATHILGRAHTYIPHPLPRPEIIPLEPYPHDALAAYERSWDTHTRALETLFATP